MIWVPARNREQGQLVTGLYERAASVPCARQAVLAGGLPGADKNGALARAAIDSARYLPLSVDAILQLMAARGMIPTVRGLWPLEAADLVHVEAQFLLKRAALRAIADGRNLLLDISMASVPAVSCWLEALRRADYTTTAVFADISVEEAVRRTTARHRRGLEDYRCGRGHGGRLIPPEAIRALAGATTTRRATAATGPPQAATGPPAPTGSVAGLIASYRRGQLTLTELAARFRARRWPPIPPACPPGLQVAAAAIDDPEPHVPGSFDEVVLAYDLGHLNDNDYRVLAAAAST
jgi:Zeta toxin